VTDLVVVLAGLGFVIAAVNAAIRVLFAMGREQALPGSLARLSDRQTPVVAIGFLTVLTLALGLPLTYADGGGHTAGYLFAAGALAVVLVYLTGNLAVIRAFRTEFRDQFRLWPHLVIPAAAVVIFLFPLWGIIRPPAYTLVNLLPFTALGWLCLGIIVARVLRARRPAIFQTLGKGFMPDEEQPAGSDSRRQPPVSSAHYLDACRSSFTHQWWAAPPVGLRCYRYASEVPAGGRAGVGPAGSSGEVPHDSSCCHAGGDRL
jgi:hypothetical protein